MLNNEGKSFAFDKRGSGYGRGEGCATVVLKRLDDAIKCNDPIRAIVRSTGVNQDGRTAGITLPDRIAQESLQRAVYKRAGLRPCEVDFIEAHGTGTVVGDNAEIHAIANVFGERGRGPLLVGSVKSNIGHLEGCSGLAGLVKAVLMLEKQGIPSNANFEAPKPSLYLEERNIEVWREMLCCTDIQLIRL